jgi:ferric-dicitrate binding protein FerR (iron transport regulator)
MDVAVRLIRTAGRREQPPPEAYERALRAATAAWQSKTRRRRQGRFSLWLAAGIAAISAVALFDRYLDVQAPIRAGEVSRAVGPVEWRAAEGEGWRAVLQGKSLSAGGTLRTREGWAAISLASGVTLRVAQASEVRLQAPSRIHVVEGVVYVDTHASTASARRIEVVTDVGTAWDVGTQFEVLYRNATWRLRVREGRVTVERGEREFNGNAGDQLLLTRDGELQRTRVPLYGSEWAWVEQLASIPFIDQRPLTDLLDWVARETGRPVRFESPDVKQAAARTVLHGSLRDLPPLDALRTVLATTDLDYELPNDGTILITVRGDARQVLPIQQRG